VTASQKFTKIPPFVDLLCHQLLGVTGDLGDSRILPQIWVTDRICLRFLFWHIALLLWYSVRKPWSATPAKDLSVTGRGAFEGSSRGHYYCHQIRGEITPGFATVWTSQKFICRLASLTPSPCLSCSWYWAMLSHKKILYSPSQKIFSDESVRSKSWLFWWYRARVVPVKADSKRSLLCSPR